MKRLVIAAFCAAVFWGGVPTTSARAEMGVAVSIKPVHSLVAGVMKGVGVPHLILKGGDSPHSYTMKPSDAKALQRAKLVFWVGPGMETFLEKPIKTLSKGATVVALGEAHGLTKLSYRESGPWAGHDHDAHEKDDHDKHARKKHDHDKHDHEKHEHEKHADKGHDDHAHGETDMHMWLDPENAKAFVHEIEEALAKADAKNAATYVANAKKVMARLDALSADLKAQFAPVKAKPFIVFHDAYQYLEKRFGLNAVGSITVSPDVKPGAARLTEIRHKIEELRAVCVFAEPQFEPKLVRVVTEGTKAKTGVLDPLGADLADGPDLYFELMQRNAKTLAACLSRTS